MEIMSMEQGTIYKAELEKSVNELFDRMLIKDGATCNFNSLVERFITTLIQTLISNPFAKEERLNKIKETFEELVSLAVYYNMPTDSAERNNLKLNRLEDDCINFFEKILAHEGVDIEADIDAGENESFIRNIFRDYVDILCKGTYLAIDLLPFGKWAKLLIKAGINLNAVSSEKSLSDINMLNSKLEDLFYNPKNNWLRLSAEQKVQAIENVINAYAHSTLNLKTRNEEDYTLPQKLDEIQRRAKNSHIMGSKDDMTSTLNADILILRDITRKAVINAIGLERAFVSVVTKNIELIREHLDEGEGAKAYRAWIRENATKLMPTRFEDIIEQGAIRENRKAIVSAVKTLLIKWE